MIINHIDKLKALYNSAEEQMPFFKRNLYDQAFEKVYSENLSTFNEINDELEHQDDAFTDSYLAELADAFVGIFKAEYDELPKKGQKSNYVSDHNTPLVIYVFPAILNYPAKWSKLLVETFVSKWNEAFKEMKISYGTYESIKNGFKYKLCYITTAVCESLNKSDDCRELNLLREYRDSVLANEDGGTDLIKEYYNIAPTIVKRINRSENPDSIYGDLYDRFITKCIDNIENKEYELCRETYTNMVSELKNRYAY